MGLDPNPKIIIESPYMTLFNVNCNIYNSGQHFQAIFCQNVHDLDYDLKNGPRSNVNVRIENAHI